MITNNRQLKQLPTEKSVITLKENTPYITKRYVRGVNRKSIVRWLDKESFATCFQNDRDVRR